MEQVTRRTLFGLGVGAVAVSALKFLSTERTDDVLEPMKKYTVPRDWNYVKVKTYKVELRHNPFTNEITDIQLVENK